MAKHEIVTVAAGTTWTELTDADATIITFQVRGDDYVLIEATSASAPTAATVVGYHYNAQMGAQNVTLTELFPGVTTPVRVFARSETNRDVDVMVSHA